MTAEPSPDVILRDFELQFASHTHHVGAKLTIQAERWFFERDTVCFYTGKTFIIGVNIAALMWFRPVTYGH